MLCAQFLKQQAKIFPNTSHYMHNVLFLGAEVCWPPYGCYNDNEPFDNNWVQLPQSPQYINTKFMLYTRKESTNPQILDDQDANSISVSNFDGRKRTVVMCHGYLGRPNLKNTLLLEFKALLLVFQHALLIWLKEQLLDYLDSNHALVAGNFGFNPQTLVVFESLTCYIC